MEWPTFVVVVQLSLAIAIPKVVVRDPSRVQERTMRILPPQMKLLMCLPPKLTFIYFKGRAATLSKLFWLLDISRLEIGKKKRQAQSKLHTYC